MIAKSKENARFGCCLLIFLTSNWWLKEMLYLSGIILINKNMGHQEDIVKQKVNHSRQEYSSYS